MTRRGDRGRAHLAGGCKLRGQKRSVQYPRPPGPRQVSWEAAPFGPARRSAPPAAPAAALGTGAAPNGAHAQGGCTSRTRRARARASTAPTGSPVRGSLPAHARTTRTYRLGPADPSGAPRRTPHALRATDHHPHTVLIMVCPGRRLATLLTSEGDRYQRSSRWIFPLRRQ